MSGPATFPLPALAQADLRLLFSDPSPLGRELEPGSLEAALDLAAGLTGCARVALRLAGVEGRWGRGEPPLDPPREPPARGEEREGVWLEPLRLPLLASGGGPARSYGVLACAPPVEPALAERAARHVSTRLVRDALERARDRDPLTGLHGRAWFERARAALDSRLAAGEALCLALVDVDGLWRLNAERGPAEGDQVLATLASAARASVGPDDHVVRYGGDELLLVLAGGAAEAEQRLGGLFELAGELGGVSLSGGLAASGASDAGAQACEVLLRRAELALAAAKEGAPGTLRPWSAELNPRRRLDRLSGVLTGQPARDQRNVELLLDALERVSRLAPLQETLVELVDRCVELSGAERGLLVLRRSPGAAWEMAVARSRGGEDLAGPYDYATSVAAAALSEGRALHHVVDAEGSLSPSADALGLRGVLCAPLLGEDVPSGVIYVDTRQAGRFDGAALAFFEALVTQLCAALRNAALYQRVLEHNVTLREDLARRPALELGGDYEGLVGRSPPMRALFQTLASLEGVASPVVIEGESGVGKERVAQAIHARSPRRAGPFVPLNCAAIPAGLFESELFGHAEGAFTGAHQARAGAFRQAEGGTLFLDEVGELPLEGQAKLLRALEEGRVRPIGEGEEVEVDVRVIAATNRDLRACVEEGGFREDLFYRLAVFRLRVPPLRDRPGDLPLLVDRILADLALAGLPAAGLSPAAREALTGRAWPGNVRELRNALERAAALARGEPIEARHLSLEEPQRARGGDLGPLFELPLREAKQLFALRYARRALDEAGGSVAAAARAAGVTRQTLYRALADGEALEG